MKYLIGTALILLGVAYYGVVTEKKTVVAGSSIGALICLTPVIFSKKAQLKP